MFISSVNSEIHKQSILDKIKNYQCSYLNILKLETNGHFFLVYQPIIDIERNKIVAVEALIRHRDFQGNITNPFFIKDYCLLGISHEVDLWVLDQAIKELHSLSIKNNLKLSVNVSPTSFYDENFTNGLIAKIKNANFPFKLVEIEVTENVWITPNSSIWSKLNVLKEHGVSIALDDFGSGKSSLSYFLEFKFNNIKMDKSLLYEKDTTIFKSCVNLIKNMNSGIVVEGVQNKQHLDLTKKQGIRMCQGFYFYEPMTLENLKNILTN